MNDEILEISIIGVGGGKSGVYDGESSTSWTLLENGNPIAIFDLGIGVTNRYLGYFKKIPERIYISHNHSDHSGELPVVLAVEKAMNNDLKLFAHPEVLRRLEQHRLHELLSATPDITSYFSAISCEEGRKIPLKGEVYIETIASIHSETCFGLYLYRKDDLILSWSADSAYNKVFYDKLWEAPTVILDGRINGNKEHAGFNEIERYISQNSKRDVYVLGYGKENVKSEKYNLGYPGLRFLL